MNSQWEPVLKDVISEVLETMFFCMVDFEEGDCEKEDFEYGSEICLLNHKGRLAISLQVKRDFAKALTANLLGIDEEDVDEDDLQDALRELANMVGGGYHARMDNSDLRLGIPRAWKIETSETNGTETTTGLRFGCYGEPAGTAVLNYVPCEAC
ncbi:MAG: chemotaxis protein CheX [Desulfobacteraceae bacterium]|nr:chemotaxis protein CheX [Desulfobacteraceae bacterium]